MAKKILIGVVASVLLLFIGLNIAVKMFVTEEKFNAYVLPVVEKGMKKGLRIGSFSASLTKGIELRKVVLFESLEEKSPLVSVKRVQVQVDLMKLLGGVLQVEHVLFDTPEVFLVRRADGTFNTAFAEEEAASSGVLLASEGSVSSSVPFDLALKRFSLTGGIVHFKDVGAKSSITLSPLNVDVKNLVIDPGDDEIQLGNIRLDLLNAGVIEASGRLSHYSSSPEIRLDASSEGVDILAFTKALHLKTPFAGKKAVVGFRFNGVKMESGKEEFVLEKGSVNPLGAGDIFLAGKLTGFDLRKTQAVHLSVSSAGLHPASLAEGLGMKLNLPGSLTKTFDITLDSRDIQKHLSFSLNAKVQDPSFFSFALQGKGDVQLVQKRLNLTLSDIEAKELVSSLQESFLKISSVKLRNIYFDLRKGRVKGKNLVIADPFFLFLKDKEGISFLNRLSSRYGGGGKEKQRGGAESSPRGRADVKPSPPLGGLTVTLGQFDVKNGEVQYRDFSSLSNNPPFVLTLKGLHLSLRGVSTKKRAKLSLSGRLVAPGGKDAVLGGKGEVNPFTLEAKKLLVGINGVPVRLFSPVSEQQSGVVLKNGLAGLSSETSIQKDGTLHTLAEVKVRDIDFSAPAGLEQVANAVVSSMQNGCGVLKLEGLEVKGNINDPQFSYISAAYATVSQVLTNPENLNAIAMGSIGAGIISGATGGAALPALGLILGGSALKKSLGDTESDCKKGKKAKPSASRKKPVKKAPSTPQDLLKNPADLLKGLF